MKMTRINVKAQDTWTTLVWYLTEDKFAVCVEVEKDNYNNVYECKFKRSVVGGFRTKADAVRHAKEMLKRNMTAKF
jgi:hypothetical protein